MPPDTQAPTPPAARQEAPQTTNGAPPSTTLDQRINRSVVWKAAWDWYMQNNNLSTEIEEWGRHVTAVAAAVLPSYEHFIATGATMPADAPASAAQPDSETPATDGTQPPGKTPLDWHVDPERLVSDLTSEQFRGMMKDRAISKEHVEKLLSCTMQQWGKDHPEANNWRDLFLTVQHLWESEYETSGDPLPW